MKSPEVNKIEGRKIDKYYDTLTTFVEKGRAKKMIETILFGDCRTLKEIMKL